jgi:hypothetical protein
VAVDVIVAGCDYQSSGCSDGQLPFEVPRPDGITGCGDQAMTERGREDIATMEWLCDQTSKKNKHYDTFERYAVVAYCPRVGLLPKGYVPHRCRNLWSAMRVVAPSREWLTERTELLLPPYAVDPHRGLPFCLADKFRMRELQPDSFRFQGLEDVPRIADEVVPREYKLEAKPLLLWVQSAAQHEPSEGAPVHNCSLLSGEAAVLATRRAQNPPQPSAEKRQPGDGK